VVDRLRVQSEQQMETFDQRLSRELRNRGLEIHGEAALLIVNGIVNIETAPTRGLVKINGVTINDLSCSSIAAQVATEVERLRGLITPPAELLGQLLVAYDRAIASSGRSVGTQVEANSILGQLAFIRQRPAFVQNPAAFNYRAYPRELFRADLYTLLSDGTQVLQGRRFRHAAGSNPSGAVFMLVPALGRAAHVGRLWFENVE